MHLMSDSSQVSANFIYQCQSYKRISVMSNYWSFIKRFHEKTGVPANKSPACFIFHTLKSLING